MTPHQRKRAEKLAEEYVWDNLYNEQDAFLAGYEAALKDAEALVKALGQFTQIRLGTMDEDNIPMAQIMARAALAKWRGEK